MATFMATFREALLACSTGSLAGLAASFAVARLVWDRAEAQMLEINVVACALREQRGALPPEAPPAAPPSSLFEAELRQEAVRAWNATVMGAHDFARRWFL